MYIVFSILMYCIVCRWECLLCTGKKRRHLSTFWSMARLTKKSSAHADADIYVIATFILILYTDLARCALHTVLYCIVNIVHHVHKTHSRSLIHASTSDSSAIAPCDAMPCHAPCSVRHDDRLSAARRHNCHCTACIAICIFGPASCTCVCGRRIFVRWFTSYHTQLARLGTTARLGGNFSSDAWFDSDCH